MTAPHSDAVPAGGAGSAWRPLAAAVAVVVVFGTAGLLADAAYRSAAADEARAEVFAEAAGVGVAFSEAVRSRVALVEGLRGWLAVIDSGPLDSFDTFAATVYEALPGLRTLQIVENGRIVDTYPREGNAGVVGYDLRTHPDPRIRDDVTRAETTGRMIITPAPDLIQGGQGLIARRRAPGAGPIRLAAVVLDLEPVLVEAGLDPLTSLAFELMDRDGRSIWRRGEVADRPVEVALDIDDGPWILRAAPRDGWSSQLPPALPLLRLLGALALALAGIALYQSLDRGRHLRAMVDERTRELRSAMDALRAQDDRLAMALRAGGVTTWEWDLDEDTVRHFPGSLDEVAIDPRTGTARFRDVAERVYADDLARFETAIRRTRERRADLDVEYRVTLPDGTVQWRRDAGRVTPDGRYVRGAVADITRSKELEEQLAHARKMEAIGQLAGGIAHDFNNLMQVVLGNAVLLEPTSGADEIAEARGEIVRAAEHASWLTSQLLAFSRRRPIRLETVDLAAEVRRCAVMLRRVVGETVVVEVEAAEPPVHVRADPSQLTQVLVNLGINARDAMPGGGRLTLRVASETVGDGSASDLDPGLYGLLEVRDEGEGIAPELIDRIFDPFFTTKAPGHGTGLGLASVYGAVRQGGGDVTVSSRPGEGTTFKVLLPLADPPP